MMPTFPRSPLSFRTAGFPQYGWKAGFPSGAFPDCRQLKPAPCIRRPTSGLHPPFVHLVATTVVPHCVGPRTRLRTAVEDHYSSAPGALAQGPGYSVPARHHLVGPIRPTRGHTAISPLPPPDGPDKPYGNALGRIFPLTRPTGYPRHWRAWCRPWGASHWRKYGTLGSPRLDGR